MGKNEWPLQRCNCWSMRVDGRMFLCDREGGSGCVIVEVVVGGGRGGGRDFS